MASPFTIPNIIKYAQISLYLANNDKSYYNLMRSGSLIQDQPNWLYLENELLINTWNLNPDPTNIKIRSAAEYVLSLCGRYLNQAINILNSLTSAPPSITGPSNVTINAGQDAVFSISVTSSIPITSIQWFDSNGNPIIGATSTTYTLPNAQVSDSGKAFYVQVTNAAGTTTSTTATLSVNASLIAKWWYGSIDPYSALSSGNDTLTYQITQNITTAQPITINYPVGAQNNQYNVLRFPATEADILNWFNTSFNYGTCPDAIMRATFSINGFKYIVSRVSMSLDSSQSSLIYSR